MWGRKRHGFLQPDEQRDWPAALPMAGTVQMEGKTYVLSHLKRLNQKGKKDSDESHL